MKTWPKALYLLSTRALCDELEVMRKKGLPSVYAARHQLTDQEYEQATDFFKVHLSGIIKGLRAKLDLN